MKHVINNRLRQLDKQRIDCVVSCSVQEAMNVNTRIDELENLLSLLPDSKTCKIVEEKRYVINNVNDKGVSLLIAAILKFAKDWEFCGEYREGNRLPTLLGITFSRIIRGSVTFYLREKEFEEANTLRNLAENPKLCYGELKFGKIPTK